MIHPSSSHSLPLTPKLQAVTDERGKVLGAVPMEFRSNNFGPPLFCSNRSSFVHLDNRQNKSERIFDTQWLFPKDTFKGGNEYVCSGGSSDFVLILLLLVCHVHIFVCFTATLLLIMWTCSRLCLSILLFGLYN